MLGVSKQAEHNFVRRIAQKQLLSHQVVGLAHEIRKEHPGCGCRKMYHLIKPEGLGRDKTEQLLLGSGFRINHPANYIRTTYSVKDQFFTNLIQGMHLTNTNQLIQTDTTYIHVKGRFYYLTFLIDVYSRRIIGHAASETLRAEANIVALKRAFRVRSGSQLNRAIHHSDRGGQFIDKEYKKLLKGRKMIQSMCTNAIENAYAERVNGIVKNEYLKHWDIKDFKDLKRKLDKAVNHYNEKRTHDSLPDKLSPVNFERQLLTLTAETKPKVIIYTEVKASIVGASSPSNRAETSPRLNRPEAIEAGNN